MSHAERVLLVEIPGGSVDLFRSLCAAAVMPHVSTALGDAAVGRLRVDGPACAAAAQATLLCGGGPELHGLLDDSRLDERRRWVRPVAGLALPCPTLAELVEPALKVGDSQTGSVLWRDKPGSFEQLAAAIAETCEAIRRTVVATEAADQRGPWRLLRVQFGVLDPLLHRLWSTLGLGDGPGGNRRWRDKAREAFSALDAGLGRLFELARQRQAAVVLAGPFGFQPFREKITVNEVLHRRGLLRIATGVGRLAYRLHRFGWKARRTLRGDSCRPVRGWLPIDWNTSRAVSLHGQAAALVYLNTRERFDTRTITTAAQREQAVADTMAALAEARHPTTDEPLFVDVYRTAQRYACDPVDRGLPEVVALPGAGFLVRQRPDLGDRLMRSDHSLSAMRSREGGLIVHAPGLVPPGEFSADSSDVVLMLLRLLGLEPGGWLHWR